MKVGVFVNNKNDSTEFDPYMDKYSSDIELVKLDYRLNPSTVDRLKESGCEAVNYFSAVKEDEDFFRKMAEAGIKYICTTSAGYDHFNIPAMEKFGIKGSNVPFYSPNAISEHAVLLMLSVLRHMREQILRIEKNQYNIDGLLGRETRNMTIGVIGTGRIGFTTIKCLSGFGPKKIYAYDPYENEAVKEYAEYTSLDSLYEKCDVILFHCVYNTENHHMVNKDTIKKMKDGVILINAARGPLFDTSAIVESVKSGKISGLGIDVIEGENLLTGKTESDSCPLPELEELLKSYNVIFTRHTAFYTDEALKNMTETSLDNFLSYARTGSSKFEVTNNK